MFLEKCGKIFFTQMRPFVFFSLLILPLAIGSIYLCFQEVRLQQLENSFSSTAPKGKNTIEKKLRKEKFLQRYAGFTPYFINEKIESLEFLSKEKTELKKLIEHPAISNKKIFKDRLTWISGEENRLTFSEENIRSSKKMKETDEKQRHPIQIDENDLQNLLCLVEDLSNNNFSTPQLIIRNFHLKRRETPLLGQVFELEMELLKREWHE